MEREIDYMRRSTKTLFTMSTAAMLMLGMATTSMAALPTSPSSPSTTTTTTGKKNGWVQEADGKSTVWRFYSNGKRYEEQWLKSGEHWYYMDSDGCMATGWNTIDDTDFYFNANGVMVTGWQKVGTNTSSSSGPSASSSYGSTWYYFSDGTITGYAEGEMVTGWLNLAGKWYYLDDDTEDIPDFEYGQMVYGEAEIDGEEYYFGNSSQGVMQVGFVKASTVSTSTVTKPGSSSSNQYFYYNDDGSKRTNSWLNLNNSWYYFDEEGYMMTGKIATDSRGMYVDYDSNDASYYYYLDTSNGKMQTGWITVKDSDSSKNNSPVASSSSDKYYQYYNESGEMRCGWLNTGNKWYYLAKKEDLSDSSFAGYALGEMAVGLKTIEGDSFFFESSGYAAMSKWKTIDGSSYYFGSDGVMEKSSSSYDLNVFKVSGTSYVVDTDGAMMKNTTIYLTKNGKYTVVEPTSSELKTTYTVSSRGYVTAK